MTELPPLIAKLAGSLEKPLTVVDVGCRWGASDRWVALPNVRLFGFDPDTAECERLNRAAADDPQTIYVPVALGSSTDVAQLHVTAEPACSSLYAPDEDLAKLRPALALISETGRQEVVLETLDRWCVDNGVEAVDFLKIDIQGAELDVLKGAPQTLDTVRIVEVEVEFNPIYLDQPLFSDVDTFLRERGFVLWRMDSLTHYGLPNGLSSFETVESAYFDHPEPAKFQGRGGQLFWANAYYVRRHMALDAYGDDWQDCLRDAVMAAGMGFWDIAAQAAMHAAGTAPPQIAEQLAALGSPAASKGSAENGAGEPVSETEAGPTEGLNELHSYEISGFATQVGARLGALLVHEAESSELPLPIPPADLPPALPSRPAFPAAVSSRRIAKRVRLDCGVEFQVIVDPELDDWKTRAYLRDEGSQADESLIDLILKLAAPGDTILDVGAFLGGLSLPAAAWGCQVVAIEPWHHAATLLGASASVNRFSNLKVLRAAATEEAGMADYYPAGYYGRIAVEGDDPVLAVPTFRVDDLVAELGGPRVRLVRLDVEGAELRVLEGMRELLGDDAAPCVLFEADDAALRRTGLSQRRLLEAFSELDYRMYRIEGKTLSLTAPDHPLPPVADCLAVKGSAPAVPGWKLLWDGSQR